ncbi:MAG: glycoside hydrolase family 99-like domain-containing protein [Planctomycetota bacterium]|nr:glycoside hydrolase family 99-like domain-containing protein [Planctomycetota bacterium]MDI6788451.1 glycoside hydrolase family 99-like domain-containing protein [Planctomycetota bacterium]
MKKYLIIGILLWLVLLNLTGYFFFFSSPKKQATSQSDNKQPILVGAYYHTYDSKKSFYWNNYLRKKLNVVQEPKLGEYSCRESEVLKQHLGWAKESGINFFAINWFGPGSASDVTVKNYIASYLKTNEPGFKFCLVYQTPYILPFEQGVIVLNREALNLLQTHFLYIADEYFKEPNYLKINDKPLLFLYVSHLMRGDYELAITKALNIVQQRTGFEIFLVGDEVLLPETDSKHTRPDNKRIAVFNAITTHTVCGPLKYDGLPVISGLFNDLDAIFKEYRNIASGLDVRFIPTAMPGFNNRGSRTEKYSILPREATLDKENEGSTYWVSLFLAMKYIDPAMNILMINSFNGFYDDTQIEPVISDFLTPATMPAELTGGYKYYGYDNLYLKLTREMLEGYKSQNK